MGIGKELVKNLSSTRVVPGLTDGSCITVITDHSIGIDQETLMPRRATPDLPPQRRQALEAELHVYGELEARATLDKYVHVSRAYDAGMTTREIGAVYGVTSDTVSRWKDLGAHERARRREGGPESG